MVDPKGSIVRVIVTAIGLHEFDRYRRPQDPFGALDIFDEHRDRIEKAASAKFDTEGAEDEGGEQVLVIGQMDLI